MRHLALLTLPPAPPPRTQTPAGPRLNRPHGARGFSILEVMLGATVMVLGIVTAITALQYGMRSVDTARNMTLAAQIMQSEVEILRLQNWSQISALAASTSVDPSTMITTGTATPLDATLTAIAARFTCTRAVSNVSGKTDLAGQPNMKLITLTVNWTGLDNRPHSLKFETRYAKNGLSDYFYVAH